MSGLRGFSGLRGWRGALTPSQETQRDTAERTDIALVVPMFNEEQGVSHLLETLHRVRNDLRDIYALQSILVDDGSTDGTWDLLQSACAVRGDVQLIRHDKNRGVAAAIMTGIRAAESEIVCSMDSDCSYDPQDLKEMVPLLEGAAMVTASPYHPDGHVVNVPAWRLFLSRNLSRLYSLVLGQKLYTYTSCFRVYRRSMVANLDLEYGDFLGIAELAIRLIGSGQQVVEYPAVLGTRKFGASKMKTLSTIRGHLRLLRATYRVRK